VHEALEAVRAAEADDVLVCGSGPTVAGIFWGAGAGQRAGVAAARLGGRFPRATPAAPVSSPA
jgi:alkyl hydroperoxide reductase subunit AhpF